MSRYATLFAVLAVLGLGIATLSAGPASASTSAVGCPCLAGACQLGCNCTSCADCPCCDYGKAACCVDGVCERAGGCCQSGRGSCGQAPRACRQK